MKREDTHNPNIDLYIDWLKARFEMNSAEELWIRQAIKGYAKDEVVRADLNSSIK